MRYHRTGQDNWTPRPQSGHSREWVHGPLRPLEDEPTMTPLRFIAHLACLVFIAVVVTLIAAALP